MAVKRTNKYLYGWKLYVDYGQGWEYETFEETRREANAQLRAYRENCPYPVKMNRGREVNDTTEPGMSRAELTGRLEDALIVRMQDLARAEVMERANRTLGPMGGTGQ